MNPSVKTLATIRERNPDTIFISLMRDGGNIFPKSIHKFFNYVFVDQDILGKIHEYFYELGHKQSSHSLNHAICDYHGQVYVNLKPDLSLCLALASEKYTNAEIASRMNRSKKSIDKYIEQLKKSFGAKSKTELIGFYQELAERSGSAHIDVPR